MRPVAARLIVVFAFVVVAALAGVPQSYAARAQDGALDSGGVGLTRAEWEAAHGPGEPADVLDYVIAPIYAYEDGTYFVGFEGSKSEDDNVVMYLEVAWDGDGVPFSEANDAVTALLPADAEITAAYVGPPTPGGPFALNIRHFQSAALGAVPYGTDTLTPDILVIFHTRLTELESPGPQPNIEERVTRASLMARIPEG